MFAYLLLAIASQSEPSANNFSYAEAGKLMVASERKQAQVRSQIKKWPDEQLAGELRYTASDGHLRMWYPRETAMS